MFNPVFMQVSIKRVVGFFLLLLVSLALNVILFTQERNIKPTRSDKDVDSLISVEHHKVELSLKAAQYHEHRADSLDKELAKVQAVKPVRFPYIKVQRNLTQDSTAIELTKATGDSTIKSLPNIGIVLTIPTTLNLIDGLREQKTDNGYINGLEAYADSISKQLSLCMASKSEHSVAVSDLDAVHLADMSIEGLMNIKIDTRDETIKSQTKRIAILQTKGIIIEAALGAAVGYIIYTGIQK